MGGLHRIACGAFALMLAGLSQARAGSKVRLTRNVMWLAGARVVVNGTISSEPLSVNLVARATRWKLGAITLRDVVATVRDHGAGLRACITGHLGTTRLDACGDLPRSSAALKRLSTIDTTVKVSGPTARGRGTARFAWRGGVVQLERSHVEIALPARAQGPITAGAATVSLDAHGGLSALDLDVTGAADAAVLGIGDFTAKGAHLPIDLRMTTDDDGAVVIVPRGALVARAAELALNTRGRTLVASTPELVVHDATPFAVRSLLGDLHVLTWPKLAGLPVDVEGGALAFRILPEGVRIECGRLHAFGAELASQPFTIDGRPLDLVISAHGLELSRLLAAVGRGRVRGSGVLDGDVVLRIDDDGVALHTAALRSRQAGRLLLPGVEFSADAMRAVNRTALHQRIAATLSDFAYDKLAVEVPPRSTGNDPEARLVMKGRARQLPQELDLVVNLRGVRAAAHHLVGLLEP